MSQSLVLNIEGLYTSYNAYSEAPAGALIEAKNIEIAQPSIAEPRRGFDRYGDSFSDEGLNAGLRATGLFEFKNTLLTTALYNNSSTLFSQVAGVWHFLDAANPVAGARVRFAASNQNVYYNTNTGIRKLDDLSNTGVAAGAPAALDMQFVTSVATPTWFLNNYIVAYRHIWTKTDFNGNLILGAPSQRYELTNTGGSTIALDIIVSCPNSSGDWILQLYRSEMLDNTSGDQEPSDEMLLVAEKKVSLTGSRQTATITDTCDENNRGVALYTNASQQGLAAQNNQPPFATDMALFDSSLFFSNIYTPQQFIMSLTSVGGTKGIAVNDTLTITSAIGTVTYTAKSTENISAEQFQVFTGGTNESNVNRTLQSLVRVINQANISVVYAYILTIDGSGEFVLQSPYGQKDPAFTITTSNPACWTPVTIASSGTATTSTNNAFQNGLYWSKQNQPEHVPLTNFVQVGSKNNPILKIVELKDALYIFKQNDGLYRMTGTGPNYSIQLLDASVKLIAPESCKVVNNQIYALTDKGVMQIDDSTVSISDPIKSDLLKTTLSNLTNVSSMAFGVEYESDMKYYLFLPSSSADLNCTFAYVYNLITGAWTTHEIAANYGYVRLDKKLYLAAATVDNVFQEQKNYTIFDYADFGYASTLSSVNGRILSITDNFDTLVVGDIVYQSANIFSTIVSIDPVNRLFTVESDPGFTVAAVTIYKPIDTVVTWAPQALQNPGILKHFHTTTLLFKQGFNGLGSLTYSTDLSASEESIEIDGDPVGLWGLFPWGEASWGGVFQQESIRQWVPRDKQLASEITITFSHAYGYSPWQLIGISLFGNPAQEKIAR